MHIRSRSTKAAALGGVVLAACTVITSCSSSPSSATPITISVQPGRGVTTLIEVAHDEGFFKAAGLNVTFKSVTSGPAAAAALASGSVDVATNAPEVFAPLVDKGLKLEVIGGQTRTIAVLVGSKSLHAPASFPASVLALKGKKVGVSALSSTTQWMVERALKAAGLTPSDVTFVASGSGVTQALAAGVLDAGVVYGPGVDTALDQGATILVDMRTKQSCPPSINPCGLEEIGMWAKDSWVSSHKSDVSKIQQAVSDADVWLHDPAHAAAADKIIGGGLGDTASAAAKAKYTAEELQILSAAFPVGDLAAWLVFDRSAGVIKHALKASDLMAPGVPQSEADVEALAAKVK